MTYKEFIALLTENFSKGGVYDSSGHWRCTAEGNTVYLSDNKGGWAYICKGINDNGYTHLVKYSVDASGKMKNFGKYVDTYYTDIKKMLDKATKYAVIEPWAKINAPIVWKRIDNKPHKTTI